MIRLVKESLYEKFTEEGDPIEDLGIGARAQIKKWFDSVGINSRQYTIDDDMHIYVEGYLDLEGSAITKLPDNLSVGGSLYLRDTKITELPKNLKVKGKIFKDF